MAAKGETSKQEAMMLGTRFNCVFGYTIFLGVRWPGNTAKLMGSPMVLPRRMSCWFHCLMVLRTAVLTGTAAAHVPASETPTLVVMLAFSATGPLNTS
jgi:hypothetical protein